MSESGEERTYDLPGGWVAHVRGEPDDDIEYGGGHRGWTRHPSHLPGATVDELRAEVAAQRTRDEIRARTPVRTYLRLTRDEVDVVVVDEKRLPSEGIASLLWPPRVVPGGVVVSWERSTVSVERPDGRPVQPGEAPMSGEVEVQRPWFVTPQGGLGQLLFEFGVPVLGTAPDGRLLLPSTHPLWWDDDNAPLSLLSLDGSTEPLLVCGGPVTPTRVLEAIGEPSSNADPESEEPFWSLRQARVLEDRLLLRLTHEELGDARTWVAVELPTEGRFTVRRLGTGELPVDDPLPPL